MALLQYQDSSRYLAYQVPVRQSETFATLHTFGICSVLSGLIVPANGIYLQGLAEHDIVLGRLLESVEVLDELGANSPLPLG